METTPVIDPEKAAGFTISSAGDANSTAPTHHHSHRLQARERIRHFLHPNGTRFHIADSPVEAEQLRRRLSTALPGDEPFSVCISGSPEHIVAVQESQSHHEARRVELSGQHGEVWQQFASVQSELDALSRELGRVTERGVALDGHFDKFGYSARIRSYDGEGSSRSSASSLKEGEEMEAPPLKLFKVPVVRQYFHKGILWRASTSEEVGSFELFVDLLYVGIIAINGDAAAEHATGSSLLKFIITFTLSWKIWNDMAMIIAWFETDDIFQRISILILLACLFGYTTNIVEAFSHTYATLIGFYLAARLYMTAYLVLVACLVPMVRSVMLYSALISLSTAALWIGSIQVSYPSRLALIFPALFLEIAGQTSYIALITLAQHIAPLRAVATRFFDFHPALNIEHRVERTNAFVSLVFGYTVVALLYQSSAPTITPLFAKALLALIQPFAFNWLYFELDATGLSKHAIRRAKASAMLWTLAHLPFIMAFVLGGGALAKLVRAADFEGMRGDEMLVEREEDVGAVEGSGEVEQGVRWFYCVGLGIALLCMAAISAAHVHRDLRGMRLGKRSRLGVRIAVAVVMLCLPLAGDRLNSLELIATVTGLVVFTLAVEVWGASRKGTGWDVRGRPCGYVGTCRERDLRSMLENGGDVDVDALGEESKYRKSGVGSAPI